MTSSEDRLQLAWSIAARNGVVCMVMMFILGAVCGWALTELATHPGYAVFAVGIALIGLIAVSVMFWRSRGLMFLPPKLPDTRGV
jgi:hypothetical protein